MTDNPLTRFLKWEQETPHNPFLRQPFDGVWKTWTFQEAGVEIRKIAQALKDYNFPHHSNIAILSKNCVHWVMADLAIMMAGHVSVPLYATLSAESIRPILEHSESKAIIIGKLDNYKLQQSGIPSSLKKITMTCYGHDEGDTWEHLIASKMPIAEVANWHAEDVITIKYTSGTTGRPKGVMHTVASLDNVLNVFEQIVDLPKNKQGQFFSYLPMSHIAERVGIELHGIYRGVRISFAESLDSFAQNLEDTQPTLFFAVPRIWAKFQEKILQKLPQKKLNRLLKIPLISSLIKNKLKKKLGLAHAVYICSGAAPLSVSLMNWFQTIGITIYQNYGMTEDGVLSHFNLPGQNKVGTVGKKLPGVESKISPEGEVRIRSKSLMKGYFKEPELTAQAFDEEGYLCTGDMAEYDQEGYLKITGRVKDQFKTDKGKYISPAPIELMLLKNPDIEHVCVVGMGVPQPMALVVLSAAGKSKSQSEIIESLSGTLDEVNPNLESYEKLETAVIMKNDWSVENGLMTPTLKVKRNEVEKIHLTQYPSWYHKDSLVVWE